MKRKLLSVWILLIIIFLTGCATVDCNFELKKNGSSVIDIKLLYDKLERNYFLTNIDSTISDFINNMSVEGYDIERFEEDEQIGYTIHKEYTNNSDLLNRGLLSQSETLSDIVKITSEDRIFYKKYRVEVTLDSSIYERWIPYTVKKIVADNVDVFVSVTLPINITNSNSNIESDSPRTAKWKLSMEKENMLILEQNIVSLPAIIGAVLIGVLFVIIFCLYIIKRKGVNRLHKPFKGG